MICFNPHISSVLAARKPICTLWNKDEEKSSFGTKCHPLSLAQETPPLSIRWKHHPPSPSIPISLPSHVLSHVVTPSSVLPQHKSLALKRAGTATVKQTKIQMAAPDSSHLHLHSLPLIFATHKSLSLRRRCALMTGFTVPSHRPSGLTASTVETVRGQ